MRAPNATASLSFTQLYCIATPTRLSAHPAGPGWVSPPVPPGINVHLAIRGTTPPSSQNSQTRHGK